MSDPIETNELSKGCPPYFEEIEQICPNGETWTLKDVFEWVLGLFGVKEVADEED
ncbi:MAG: hypothetical protein UX38_C0004G0073 [Microgenomates group bacterium GW2011_GWC1_46_16]|nr:MAG: hypothetical protein UX32_C0003G0047 [Microgenomates group bacterium GW2011_GWF1_46_12]KKU26693.1 MAG: hypothetical protein UX38_C0004G0073 [Microgenomates group bacterium GW2011_GWC1_46_16]KKU28058.1 MAG: hypothetical protein UX40_C0003G0005 [Microgenomates group bacterium GW2011_GWF2_46_18]KKU44058.1 MAG: hypothetical protein UX59_C0004G0009 [Microgenomates group bacterium GW2011_GWA1_46_7]KKU45723.1 MAG: hypothetical protein UX63_C0001G0004 [Microgenomates group bacterium GW2011_GWB1